MLKQLFPLALMAVLLTGCQATFTNLTPRQQVRNDDGSSMTDITKAEVRALAKSLKRPNRNQLIDSLDKKVWSQDSLSWLYRTLQHQLAKDEQIVSVLLEKILDQAGFRRLNRSNKEKVQAVIRPPWPTELSRQARTYGLKLTADEARNILSSYFQRPAAANKKERISSS